MSAAQPPRTKAGGFEQRMAKGPDGKKLCPCLYAFVCSCDALSCSLTCSFQSDGQGEEVSKVQVEDLAVQD